MRKTFYTKIAVNPSKSSLWATSNDYTPNLQEASHQEGNVDINAELWASRFKK